MLNTPLRSFTALGLLLLGTACQPGGSPLRGPDPQLATLRPRMTGRLDLVSQEEIQSVEPGATTFDAVRRLRPELLRRHATPIGADPEGGFAVVYLDGVRLGGLETLADVAAAAVIEIRYLRAAAALEAVGRNHRGGVLLVSTTR